MKKILYLMTMLPLLAFFGSCSEKEEIVFDHEQPAFDTRENAILIEAIMPSGTAADDVIYIVGAFNGGDAAVGNMAWQMEHSTVIPEKWGIYLDPSTFVEGTSLADGFWFVSESEGVERTVRNETANHTLDAGVGTRNNVYVDRWASYFEVPETIEHDGYVIYVEDQTGWDALALYTHTPELFGGWPGALATGTEEIDGRTYTYFDMGWDNAGKTTTLIFNNNNNGIQLENFDVLKNVTIDRNYFFRLTADNVELLEDIPQSYYIYANDQTGWDDLALYAWGDAEIFGLWPGIEATGKSITINDVEYKQFALPEDAAGKAVNLIFNENVDGGAQAADLSVTIEEHDLFVSVTASTATIVDITGEGGSSEPEPEEPGYKVYIDDQTGWETLHAHYWIEEGFSTEWPGKELTETIEVGGVTYKVLTTEKSLEGLSVGIIFHRVADNTETERVTTNITLDQDRYYRLTTSALTEVFPESGE